MANMSLHKSAEWKPGLRTYFEYRDLGSVEATRANCSSTSSAPPSPAAGRAGITPTISSSR